MPITDPPVPSLKQLLASWYALSRAIVRVCVARLGSLLDGTSNRVKDAILDLDLEKPEPGPTGEAKPLPLLNPEQLVSALRPRLEQLVRQAAEIINEDPSLCWEGVTEERLAVLFRELQQMLLEQALELRIQAAEAEQTGGRSEHQGWARKYRRIQAREGRWPGER